MATATFQLRYADTVGFVADQGGRGFHLPMSMVIRGDGRIFVVSRSNTQALDIVGIQMVTREHDFFGQMGGYGREPGNMIWPTALALDANDPICTSPMTTCSGSPCTTATARCRGTWGSKGGGAGEFDGPLRPAVRRRGQPAGRGPPATTASRNSRRDGRSLGAWGGFGSGDGQFNLPWGITQDREGFLYVADWRNDRIQKFTPDGAFVARFGASGQRRRAAQPALGPGGGCGRQPVRGRLGQPARPGVRRRKATTCCSCAGEARLSPWAQEYIEANADEHAARGTYVPVFDVDTDAADEGVGAHRALFLGPG